MDTIHGTTWDVVIAGTGLQESLLALSLSRSGKQVLHVDKNGYYGGAETALSLQDALEWAETIAASQEPSVQYVTPFSNVHIETSSNNDQDDGQTLSFPRAYSLALAPHVLYAQSAILPTLVSSKVDQQLDFLVLGSWWTYTSKREGDAQASGTQPIPGLKRVPNGREDLFADQTVGLKDKRALMKFLRFVSEDQSESELLQGNKSTPFHDFLGTHFKLSDVMQQPIHALAMSSLNQDDTTTSESLLRIARHLRSIGVFGQGFGAVVPKWGGLAELAQVACRACAVGGGVYVLGNGVVEVTSSQKDDAADEPRPVSVKLSSGDIVSTEWIVSAEDNLPAPFTRPQDDDSSSSTTTAEVFSRSISIISSPLEPLFPSLGEGVPTPAGAVVIIAPSELDLADFGHSVENVPPVHILAHSSDTGECPAGQCILYANIALPSEQGYPLLQQAVDHILSSLKQPDTPAPRVLWRLQYEQHASKTSRHTSKAVCPDSPEIEENFITFPHPPLDLVFDDSVLKRVLDAWKMIMGEDAEGFMTFEQRELAEDVEDSEL